MFGFPVLCLYWNRSMLFISCFAISVPMTVYACLYFILVSSDIILSSSWLVLMKYIFHNCFNRMTGHGRYWDTLIPVWKKCLLLFTLLLSFRKLKVSYNSFGHHWHNIFTNKLKYIGLLKFQIEKQRIAFSLVVWFPQIKTHMGPYLPREQNIIILIYNLISCYFGLTAENKVKLMKTCKITWRACQLAENGRYGEFELFL